MSETENSKPTPTGPRALRDPGERARRRAMLGLPHVAPLTAYARRLRGRGRGTVPDFDPLDAGIGARALFLMEKPGPMTDADAPPGARLGSGFISRDNDDPTAEATFRFMLEAGIPRSKAVLWNLVPWWNGTRRVARAELANGAEAVSDLVALLPDLRAIVLVGARARQLERRISNLGYATFGSDHPSPIVRASRPERWRAIPSAWRQVGPLLESVLG